MAKAAAEKRPDVGLMFIGNLDRGVYTRFKAWCALRGSFINREVERLMREAVEREGRKRT